MRKIVAAALIAANLGLAAPARSDTLERVAAVGALRVCTTGDYRPFSFALDDAGYEGIDIDLAGALARSLGVRARFVRTSWPHLMDDFAAGKCDIAMGGISVTAERARRAWYSTSYLRDGKSAIARCADVGRFATLAGIDQPEVRVIVNPGGTNERFAVGALHAAQIRVYPDNLTIFDEIVRGGADVMITDTSEVLLQHRLHPELCAANPQAPFVTGEKAYLLPTGDEAFRHYVDLWLDELRTSHALDAVLDHWLR